MTLTDLNIEALLILCKKNNRLAQLEVYNRYQRAMYNTAIRIVKNIDDAEDIMQESFITAFNKLGSLKENLQFGAWLKRIVVNNCLNHLRKSALHTALSEDEITEEIDENERLAEEDYSKIKAAKVLEEMGKLHKSYNQVLTLHLIEGYDYEEICEILNITYANCRTLISRAKDSLRKQLTK